jgi:hypothetical protein
VEQNTKMTQTEEFPKMNELIELYENELLEPYENELIEPYKYEENINEDGIMVGSIFIHNDKECNERK